MTWWCASTRLPWDWQPRFYPGVWAFVAALAIAGVTIIRRTGVRITGRQRAAAWGGLLATWVALDWPVGTLGSGYLASIHMVQYMIFTFVVGPLLVLAIPEELARRFLAHGRRLDIYRAIARPLPAALITNGILIATHAPITVDTLRMSQAGSFAIDLVWMVGGVLLWLPVCGPLPEVLRPYPIRGIYLFMAAGVVPMLPGGFLTFADFPLYSLYELAPRIGGIDPLTDQQTAGALMKIGSIPFIWPVIGTMFWRWAVRDREPSAPIRRAPTPAAPPAASATAQPAASQPAPAPVGAAAPAGRAHPQVVVHEPSVPAEPPPAPR